MEKKYLDLCRRRFDSFFCVLYPCEGIIGPNIHDSLTHFHQQFNMSVIVLFGHRPVCISYSDECRTTSTVFQWSHFRFFAIWTFFTSECLIFPLTRGLIKFYSQMQLNCYGCHFVSSDPLLFGESQEPLTPDEWPDLSLLKPLWMLFTKTMGTETGLKLNPLTFSLIQTWFDAILLENKFDGLLLTPGSSVQVLSKAALLLIA